MITSVIFDWIGTLYERNMGSYPDSQETLDALRKRGIKMSLISLSKDERKRTLEIERSGLGSFFDHIMIDKEKNAFQYRACAHLMSSSSKNILVVDDRTIRGIQIGNQLQFQTAWIKRGEYKHELPNEETGKPNYIIRTVREILPIVFGSMR